MKWNSFNDYMPGTKVENMLICFVESGGTEIAYSICKRHDFDYNKKFFEQKTRKELHPRHWIDLDKIEVNND